MPVLHSVKLTNCRKPDPVHWGTGSSELLKVIYRVCVAGTKVMHSCPAPYAPMRLPSVPCPVTSRFVKMAALSRSVGQLLELHAGVGDPEQQETL